MSTATANRNSETAKAPQLKGWTEIFRAGTHTDSKGRESTWTKADLDEIARNHSLGPAPAVLGHPKDNDPAYAWTSGLRVEGESLFAAWEDINPAFDDGLASRAYDNRSVSIVREAKHGLRLRHVGWLGAAPPAIVGLATEARQFAAAEGEVFEFAASDDALGSLAWAVNSVGELLRGVRDHLIASESLETADRVLPSYSIDYLINQARSAREALQRDPASSFSQPTPTGDDLMTITQAQHDAAVAAAKEQGRAEATNDFAAQGQELAELRKQRKDEKIQKVIDDLKAKGKLIPAQEAQFKAFLEHLSDQGGTFEFTAADGAKSPLDPLQYMHDFMSQQAAVVKLGTTVVDPAGQADAVDVNDSDSLAKAARDFQAAAAKEGQVLTFAAALTQVTGKAKTGAA